MNKTELMDFVFVDRIKRELQLFVEHPELAPPVLCFFGLPGIGKTSFAKAWSTMVANDVCYEAMNEKKNASKGAEVIRTSVSLEAFICNSNKPLSRVTILDEFHNLSPKQQDTFKVILESLDERDRTIICLNTELSRPLNKQLSAPILSRCHTIDFNIRYSEIPELVEKCMVRYKHLDKDTIRRLIPDQRAMAREDKLQEAKRRLCVA